MIWLSTPGTLAGLLVLHVGLHAADLYTTEVAIRVGLREGNPLPFMQTFRGRVIAKLVACVGVVSAVLLAHDQHADSFGIMLLVFLNALMVGVVLWNARQIRRVRVR